MFTIAVAAQKGGVGKTTLILHLAVEAAKTGPVVVIDMDPQSSVAQWALGRKHTQPAVLTCPAARLPQTLVSRCRSSHHSAAASFANFGIKGTPATY